MKPPVLTLGPWLMAVTAWSIFSGASVRAADSSAKSKPVLLYSRYYNAQGETRYLPDGNYQEVLQRLREEFEVRVHNQPLTPQNLADVKLLVIANPSEKRVGTNPPPPHVSSKDIELLSAFVHRGGGLLLMENQENHNLEIKDSNQLLARFGLQATNLYTDAKKLKLPKNPPLLGGLRWAYFTGNLLVPDPEHPAKPRALVMNDLRVRPLKGKRDQAGVLMAAAEPGKGRVVVVTDSGWVTDAALKEEDIGGLRIQGQDNWEIFRRLTRWTAHLSAAAPRVKK